MNNPYYSLLPLIREKALITDPAEFHAVVNVIFHDYESNDYDALHREMWESLPQQFGLLDGDIRAYVDRRPGLKLLDIGCGTGLATEMFLKTAAGKSVSTVDLLDTSVKMLDIAKKRAASWEKQVNAIVGDIASVQDKYDMILISSVLHHIPDLGNFFEKVDRLQEPGGLLITLHDPFADALESEVYARRVSAYSSHRHNLPPIRPPFGKSVGNKMRRLFRIPSYMDRINQKLLNEKVISRPLTETELWSITDIHVEGLPYSTGKGIAKEVMIRCLPSYCLLSLRTYAFFGYLSSNLDSVYQLKEKELSIANDPYGRNFCSVWIKE